METTEKSIENLIGKECYARFKRNLETLNRFNFYDGSNDDLNTLREAKRTLEQAYNEAYRIIQDKIDEKILEANDITKFEHQYIRIKDVNFGGDEYKYVNRIERLNNGCRMYGPTIVVYEDDSDFHYCADDDRDRLVRFEDIQEGLVEIINVEKWNEIVERCIKKIQVRTI